MELSKESPLQGWDILENLLKSDDPDDRDTALVIFQEINDPRAYSLVKPLLYDQYPYLRYEACEFLEDVYPDEVVTALKDMLHNPDERVRLTAEKMLAKMKGL